MYICNKFKLNVGVKLEKKNVVLKRILEIFFKIIGCNKLSKCNNKNVYEKFGKGFKMKINKEKI
jgi:hypothetical protein